MIKLPTLGANEIYVNPHMISVVSPVYKDGSTEIIKDQARIFIHGGGHYTIPLSQEQVLALIHKGR